ncbi:MAG: gamma-butyrobetaine hydroxylase-like domain-containing protein [Gammaproteobacteria bacterium]
MAPSQRGPVPTQLNLHRQSKSLELSFDDGSHFNLPCEYLRVFSPSAEVRVAESRGETVIGKERVNITRIEPVGHYAVRLSFDDGHDTGVYSWETLYELGRNYENNWRSHLERKQAMEARRAQAQKAGPAMHRVKVRVLFFERLVDRMGSDMEELTLESSTPDLRALLASLRSRDPDLNQVLADQAVKVTVNKQFVAFDTWLQDGDEVAIVPIRPLV